MITLDLNINDLMTKSLEDIKKRLTPVPTKTFNYFVSVTPVRSGRARRSTRLDKETIVANYPYAERLDQGYSKQAPRGMTEPTVKYFEQQVQTAMRKK